ncbi:hypothetical protein [Demequina aestuarii]|uniref:hypothetical protein n=1 Tax=Demequina aestuarii TaxID=327095 RepID=UPI0007857B88|nr:hypothetical protein [Demequina aestuarii]
MRAVAAAISGAYALLIMTAALPWDAAECADATCVTSGADAQFFPTWFTLTALAVPTLLLFVILRGVLGMVSSRDPEEGAVLAALGQTRSTSIRTAALSGLRDGAIAVSAAFLIAAGIHVAMLVGTDLNPVTTSPDMWASRAIMGAAVLLALVLAHITRAAHRPRTPVEALAADLRGEPAHRPSLRVRALLTGTTLALSGGIIAGLAIAERDAGAWDVSFYVTNTAGIAMMVAWLSALTLGLWVAVPWLRGRRGVVLDAAARAVGRDGRVGAVLATYAGDRSRASARIVTVLAVLGFLIASVPSQDPYPAVSDRLVSITSVEGDVDAIALADRYRAIEGVDHVIPAQGIMLEYAEPHSSVYAVAPKSLRSWDDPLADALERHPTSVAASLWNGQAPTDLVERQEFNAEGIVPIEDCCAAFVNADFVDLTSPQPAFFIFSAEDADIAAVTRAIDDVTWQVPGATGTGSSTPGGYVDSSMPLWNTLVNAVLYAAVFILPLVLVAVGAVRRRRDDDGTLTALGATARTMRAAVAIEMAVVSAFTLAGGMAVGAAIRVLMTALQQGRLSLRSVEVDSALMMGLLSTPWTAMAIVGITSVAVMTITAYLTAWATGRPSGRRPTPVDALRTKAKEGVR